MTRNLCEVIGSGSKMSHKSYLVILETTFFADSKKLFNKPKKTHFLLPTFISSIISEGKQLTIKCPVAGE